MSEYKNNIFPEFMKIELCEKLVSQINCIVEKHKQFTKEAVIYSMVENKTIKSDRRVSHKNTFQSNELRHTINKHIINLIYSILDVEYPNAKYDVSIGTQSFDYIKYDNGGYFDKHKDFVRVSNCTQRQYTMLIGLTKNNSYSYGGGNTILWFPVDSSNIEDYNKLINISGNYSANNRQLLNKDTELLAVLRKYNLSACGDSMKTLLATNENKYIPYRINSFDCGKSLLFKSDIVHSGEEFYNWYSAKELLMFNINITGIDNNVIIAQSERMNQWLNDPTHSQIIMFDEFEHSMVKTAEENILFPFQIIISSGEYNHKKFFDKYLKYLNLQDKIEKDDSYNILERINSTLVEIYNKTKIKLNKRGRETHISSEILEESSDLSRVEKLNGVRFNTSHLSLEEIDTIDMINYMNIITSTNNVVSHIEKINNTWEESSCNDDGDEYDETTYLHCNIDIKFCFMKI